MTATIQIKGVPDDLHRQLKARAECEGISVPQLILQELRNSAARASSGVMPPAPDSPPLKETLDRLASQPERRLSPSAADIIREMRGPLPGRKRTPGAAEGILKGTPVKKQMSDRESLMSNFE